METETEKFERIRDLRGVPNTVNIGSIVELGLSGWKGTIIGANDNQNFDVIFNGRDDSSNVHPTWDIQYTNNNGDILYDAFERNK